MNEILEERRLVSSGISSGYCNMLVFCNGWEMARRTLVIPVSLDIPVGVNILGVVGFVASDFNLLETPLRQVDVTSTKVASQYGMLESEGSGQGSDLGSIVRGNILNNFHGPVILFISNSCVSIT